MDKDFFEEMRKISHKDDLRSKLLLFGVRQMLEEKQEQKGKRRLFGLMKNKAAIQRAEKYVSPWSNDK
ncbi:MAG: hypothetical protein ACE3L7_08605 [Candidatus Pristimantibacillus sp.]